MRHAEAHERLADLALEPGRLHGFETDPAPELASLRAHVRTCRRCAADLADWRRTWSEAGPALLEREPASVFVPPAGLRDRILEAAAKSPARPTANRGALGAQVERSSEMESHAEPTGPRTQSPAASAPRTLIGSTPRSLIGSTPRSLIGSTAGSRRPRPVAWLAAAAAILVAIGGVTFGWIRQGEADQLRAQASRLQAEVAELRTEAGELRDVAAAFDRILAVPRHWVVTLRTADGMAGGTLAWTASEIVMVADGLPAPAPGQVYRCWVEDSTGRSSMGPMAITGSTGYWVSSMAPWSDAAWADAVVPGVRFGVSLVSADGPGTAVLIGSI